MQAQVQLLMHPGKKSTVAQVFFIYIWKGNKGSSVLVPLSFSETFAVCVFTLLLFDQCGFGSG